ncbi:hypothetical protein L228DRAFT_238137 [Xylona heveae TC161]|uniref:Uncharacterized protein n=1 Tax=Xylona heveae (strain CBS 132557 / TC161) TaxID=1328760 RepID=A0A165HIX4_XYLHT|nr:hypothetical protein L228DRAFT_238137 [Xylona heveae TC161]KZF23586.1 hypothetical protein L228DRAFT_238137 [Xylona heveae TC161]
MENDFVFARDKTHREVRKLRRTPVWNLFSPVANRRNGIKVAERFPSKSPRGATVATAPPMPSRRTVEPRATLRHGVGSSISIRHGRFETLLTLHRVRQDPTLSSRRMPSAHHQRKRRQDVEVWGIANNAAWQLCMCCKAEMRLRVALRDGERESSAFDSYCYLSN